LYREPMSAESDASPSVKQPLGRRLIAGWPIAERPWFFPLGLLLVGLVAYGLIFWRPGFYWDDWEAVYLYYMHRPDLILHYYTERPFAGLAYLLLFPVARMTPPVWQAVALVLRLSGVLLIYATLCALWPKHVWQNRWIAVLLFVYPGYLLQPYSVGASDKLTAYLFFAGSLFLMVAAIKSEKRFWLLMPSSVLLGLAQTFMLEFFVGLELVRPLVIWLALRSRKMPAKRVYWQTLLLWAPFLLILGLYVWWRLVYLPTTMVRDPNTPGLLQALIDRPNAALQQIGLLASRDIGYLTASVWYKPFAHNALSLSSRISVLSWLAGAAAAAAFALAFRQQTHRQDRVTSAQFILGFAVLVLGSLPAWALGRQALSAKWTADRFALAPMLGGVILAVCIIDRLLRFANLKQAALAIMLASSIALQIHNARDFLGDWQRQTALFWQLHWRIPSLEKNTALIGNGDISFRTSDYDAVYAFNLLFGPQAGGTLSYTYFAYYDVDLTQGTVDVPLVRSVRAGTFSGSSAQSLVIDFKSPGGCALVLDPIYRGDPALSPSYADFFDISRVAWITSEPGIAPNPDVFGTEPPHDWCYYFEKADLARQFQDWALVLQLKSRADAQGLAPNRGAEYVPFIEASAHSGQWQAAYEMSVAGYELDSRQGALMCETWKRLAQVDSGPDARSFADKAQGEFCPAGSADARHRRQPSAYLDSLVALQQGSRLTPRSTERWPPAFGRPLPLP
jgi:hypothetical protein